MCKSKRGFSRRDFIRTAGVIGVGSLLQSTTAMGRVAKSIGREGGLMAPTRPFGKTGVKVSCLALGGMFDIPSNQLLLKQALKWGVTYWDTADCYGGGRSEKGIGDFFARRPESRNKVFLATKSDSRDPEGMSRLLNRSLERMQTDYVDLYLLHGVRSIKELNGETRAWVRKAKSTGKIRFFGFSSHSNMEECLAAAAKLGWIDGIMMAYNYRLMHSEGMKAAVAACSDAGIGLTAMKTQGGGPVRSHTETELKLAGSFLQKGFTDKQAKLKAVWENKAIASICSQMPNLTILTSNVAAALDRTNLSAGEMRRLDLHARETASAYCAGCTGICERGPTDGVPIGDVMRYLMYYRSYGECDLARSLYAQLSPETRKRLHRVDYSLVEQRCPQGLPVGKLIREAVEILA